MVERIWSWQEEPRLGGGDGGVYASLFKNQEFDAADLLVREVIQNSWDAATYHSDPDVPFRVVFRFRTLAGDEKAAFVGACGLAELAQKSNEQTDRVLGIQGQQSLTQIESGEPLSVLLMEDYGTHGLFGHPDKERKKSHFRRALFDLGKSQKSGSGAPASGGSYGFGKSAFISASAVHLVVAYSCFAPRPSDAVTRRAAASVYWRGFDEGDCEYTGRALFGAPVSDGHGGESADPFEDEYADHFADLLGIDVREPENPAQRGTTFLLVEPSVTPGELKTAIERWWWPALHEGLISVEVIDAEGHNHPPTPALNEDVRPYLKAYELALNPAAVSGGRESSVVLPATGHGLATGSVGLFAPEASDDQVALSVTVAGYPWMVATMRRQRMVIQYRKIPGRRPDVRGCFVADDAVDGYLKSSEPPLHHYWSKNPSNDVDPSDLPKVKQLVRDIERGVTDAVTQFALSVEPDPVTELDNLNELERLISSLVDSRWVTWPPPPPPGDLPLRMKVTEELVPHPDQVDCLQLRMRIELQLTDNAPRANQRVEVDARIALVEDGARAPKAGRLPVTVTLEGAGEGFADLGHGRFTVTVKKITAVTFLVATHPYESTWTVLGNPQARFISNRPQASSGTPS